MTCNCFIIFEILPRSIDFTESKFCSMWIFCHVEIPDWLFHTMSIWLFSVCLFDFMYIPALYVVYTYMSYINILADVVFK